MRIVVVILLFLLPALPVGAVVVPASVFSDHMVLQREQKIPVWGLAAAGERIRVKLHTVSAGATAGRDGRWLVWLEPMKAGGPYTLTIQGKNVVGFQDVYVGEVWLCSGQSNMDMTVAREDRYWCGVNNEAAEVASAHYPLIRVFDVPFNPRDTAQTVVAGMWEVCSPQTVGHFSAAAYFFARALYMRYRVPIGLITTAYGASTAEAWIPRKALAEDSRLTFLLQDYDAKCWAYDTAHVAQQKYRADYAAWKLRAAEAETLGKDKPREPKNPDPHRDQHNPSVLYNGMVAPLVPFAFRGVIWYQGESNGPTATIYKLLQETLIHQWRDAWHMGSFPFLYVQLANHQAVSNQPVQEDAMVLVREGQFQSLAVANTGMVVAIDNASIDNPGDIHPKNKQDIGLRLSLLARGLVYGDTVAYSGPLYDRVTTAGAAMRIHFRFAGKRLVVHGDSLRGFAIAGVDKKFVWAHAVVDGQTVIVSHPDVPKPVAVRYGWARNPPVNLYNDAGLPASPFRTDIEILK